MDFTFDDYENESEKSEVIHAIKLKNQNGKTFYNKLTYIYLEMLNFNKEEADLKTRMDKWLYFIKHLEDFQNIPAIFNDSVFSEAFEKAEIAKFDVVEFENYQRSLKIFRDNKAVFDYAMITVKELAFEEGKMQGMEKAKLDTAKSLKSLGIEVAILSKSTGLTQEEIEKL